jgi:hypothetical protein
MPRPRVERRVNIQDRQSSGRQGTPLAASSLDKES